MRVEWTYNSNAIEGNTLSLRETRLVLEAGLTVGGKSLREHLEVVNHREAIGYVESLAGGEEWITPLHVRRIHALVLAGMDEGAGRYRETAVGIAGASFEPAGPWEAPSLMDGWARWIEGSRRVHPVERAALAHHRLAAIHPFADGNGRTARLVMNLLLMRSGYPPTVIQRANRRQYYAVLGRADEGDEAPLADFVARAVERGLTLYLEALTPRETPPAPEDEWIPLREAARGTPYSQEYLSLLARKGRLEAIKHGKVWRTTRRAVEDYRSSVSGET